MEANSQDLPPDPLPPADVVHAPRLVVGDRGAGWVVESWDRFRAAPAFWIGISLLYLVVTIVLGSIPFIGPFARLLSEVFMGGLLLACHAQQQGQPLQVMLLFQCFTRKFVPLLWCGVIQAVITLAIYGVVLVPSLLRAFNDLFPGQEFSEFDPMALAEKLQGMDPLRLLELIDYYNILLKLAVCLALLIPVYAAFWFAPALIVLGNKGLKDALVLSFTGTLKNSWPFLIYGLCAMLLCLLVPFTLGLALLPLTPMFFLSMYLSYRDIYLD